MVIEGDVLALFPNLGRARSSLPRLSGAVSALFTWDREVGTPCIDLASLFYTLGGSATSFKSAPFSMDGGLQLGSRSNLVEVGRIVGSYLLRPV